MNLSPPSAGFSRDRPTSAVTPSAAAAAAALSAAAPSPADAVLPSSPVAEGAPTQRASAAALPTSAADVVSVPPVVSAAAAAAAAAVARSSVPAGVESAAADQRAHSPSDLGPDLSAESQRRDAQQQSLKAGSAAAVQQQQNQRAESAEADQETQDPPESDEQRQPHGAESGASRASSPHEEKKHMQAESTQPGNPPKAQQLPPAAQPRCSFLPLQCTSPLLRLTSDSPSSSFAPTAAYSGAGLQSESTPIFGSSGGVHMHRPPFQLSPGPKGAASIHPSALQQTLDVAGPVSGGQARVPMQRANTAGDSPDLSASALRLPSQASATVAALIPPTNLVQPKSGKLSARLLFGHSPSAASMHPEPLFRLDLPLGSPSSPHLPYTSCDDKDEHGTASSLSDDESEPAPAAAARQRQQQQQQPQHQQLQLCPPWTDAASLTVVMSAHLHAPTDVFSTFPAIYSDPSSPGVADLSRWVAFQQVLLVHPDVESERLRQITQSPSVHAQQQQQQQLLQPQQLLPYTPIPAMLFGGAPPGVNNSMLALLLADVVQKRDEVAPADAARLAALQQLKHRLLALEREALCGGVVPAAVADEEQIIKEYRQLAITWLSECRSNVTAHTASAAAACSSHSRSPSPDWTIDELAFVDEMLAGDPEACCDLQNSIHRRFLSGFHKAHIHVYELDMPVDVSEASSASGSLASRAIEQWHTAPGGLYVAFNSDSSMLHGGSQVEHDRAQAACPRILIALTAAVSSDDPPRYSPLIPLPNSLIAGELHPWSTAMHSAKIPLALIDLREPAQINKILYLQPRYTGWIGSGNCVPKQVLTGSLLMDDNLRQGHAHWSSFAVGDEVEFGEVAQESAAPVAVTAAVTVHRGVVLMIYSTLSRSFASYMARAAVNELATKSDPERTYATAFEQAKHPSALYCTFVLVYKLQHEAEELLQQGHEVDANAVTRVASGSIRRVIARSSGQKLRMPRSLRGLPPSRLVFSPQPAILEVMKQARFAVVWQQVQSRLLSYQGEVKLATPAQFILSLHAAAQIAVPMSELGCLRALLTCNLPLPTRGSQHLQGLLPIHKTTPPNAAASTQHQLKQPASQAETPCVASFKAPAAVQTFGSPGSAFVSTCTVAAPAWLPASSHMSSLSPRVGAPPARRAAAAAAAVALSSSTQAQKRQQPFLAAAPQASAATSERKRKSAAAARHSRSSSRSRSRSRGSPSPEAARSHKASRTASRTSGPGERKSPRGKKPAAETQSKLRRLKGTSVPLARSKSPPPEPRPAERSHARSSLIAAGAAAAVRPPAQSASVHKQSTSKASSSAQPRSQLDTRKAGAAASESLAGGQYARALAAAAASGDSPWSPADAVNLVPLLRVLSDVEKSESKQPFAWCLMDQLLQKSSHAVKGRAQQQQLLSLPGRALRNEMLALHSRGGSAALRDLASDICHYDPALALALRSQLDRASDLPADECLTSAANSFVELVKATSRRGWRTLAGYGAPPVGSRSFLWTHGVVKPSQQQFQLSVLDCIMDEQDNKIEMRAVLAQAAAAAAATATADAAAADAHEASRKSKKVRGGGSGLKRKAAGSTDTLSHTQTAPTLPAAEVATLASVPTLAPALTPAAAATVADPKMLEMQQRLLVQEEQIKQLMAQQSVKKDISTDGAAATSTSADGAAAAVAAAPVAVAAAPPVADASPGMQQFMTSMTAMASMFAASQVQMQQHFQQQAQMMMPIALVAMQLAQPAAFSHGYMDSPYEQRLLQPSRAQVREAQNEEEEDEEHDNINSHQQMQLMHEHAAASAAVTRPQLHMPLYQPRPSAANTRRPTAKKKRAASLLQAEDGAAAASMFQQQQYAMWHAQQQMAATAAHTQAHTQAQAAWIPSAPSAAAAASMVQPPANAAAAAVLFNLQQQHHQTSSFASPSRLPTQQ